MKKLKEVKNQNRMLAFGLLFLMFMAGCTSPSQPAPKTQTENLTPLTPPTAICSDKECFISAANECQDTSITLTEDMGILKYSSSKDCVFTKTLVSLNENETQEMKNILQGKSLTCKYEKGKFDQRLVTSLIYGMEYCEGELKDTLGQLIVFS